jgi:hypothetical protein
MAYVTVAEYKAWLNALNTQRVAVASDGQQEAEYQIFLDDATALIESETKRVFSAVTTTKYFGKEAVDNGRPTLLLTPDMLTVTAVVNGDGASVDSSNYFAYPRNTTRKYAIELTPTSSVGWVFTNGYVSVTGTWGVMASPNAFVKHLTMRIAWWMQQTRTTTGQVTTFGDGTRTQDGATPPDIVRDLNRLTLREVV